LILPIFFNLPEKNGFDYYVGATIDREKIETGLHVTTPDPWTLQFLINQAVKAGCRYLVLEVTSHALSQERVWGIGFDTALLTNITREHLDYHQNFENYMRAKAKLFYRSKFNLVNEEYPSLLISLSRKGIKVTIYGFDSLSGELKQTVNNCFEQDYNRLNATAAVLVAEHYHLRDKDIILALKTFQGVEGRLQKFPIGEELKYLLILPIPQMLLKMFGLFAKSESGEDYRGFGLRR